MYGIPPQNQVVCKQPGHAEHEFRATDGVVASPRRSPRWWRGHVPLPSCMGPARRARHTYYSHCYPRFIEFLHLDIQSTGQKFTFLIVATKDSGYSKIYILYLTQPVPPIHHAGWVIIGVFSPGTAKHRQNTGSLFHEFLLPHISSAQATPAGYSTPIDIDTH